MYKNSHLLHTTEEEAGCPPGARNGLKYGRENPAERVKR